MLSDEAYTYYLEVSRDCGIMIHIHGHPRFSSTPSFESRNTRLPQCFFLFLFHLTSVTIFLVVSRNGNQSASSNNFLHFSMAKAPLRSPVLSPSPPPSFDRLSRCQQHDDPSACDRSWLCTRPTAHHQTCTVLVQAQTSINVLQSSLFQVIRPSSGFTALATAEDLRSAPRQRAGQHLADMVALPWAACILIVLLSHSD